MSNIKKDECDSCGSANTYRKAKGKIRVCRKCGTHKEFDEQKKEELMVNGG